MNKKIIWLASYPKCGNTYLRCFLSHYIYDQYKNFSFENLKRISRFESKETFSLVKKYLTDEDRYILYCLKVQKDLIQKLPQKKLIFKTHHFFGSIDGHQFTSEKYTLLFIYILRDPREVLVSYARHSGITIDEMIKLMTHDQKIIRSGFQTLVNWGQNYRSWKSFTNVPSYFVKFEDLISNPIETFESIVFFISRYTNIPFDKKKIKAVTKLITFNKLQALEKKIGFDEAHHSNFFRSGKINTWKDILNKDQIKIIEDSFKKEMEDLGYIF